MAQINFRDLNNPNWVPVEGTPPGPYPKNEEPLIWVTLAEIPYVRIWAERYGLTAVIWTTMNGLGGDTDPSRDRAIFWLRGEPADIALLRLKLDQHTDEASPRRDGNQLTMLYCIFDLIAETALNAA